MNNKGAFASAPGSEKTIAQQISGAIFQAIFALIDGLLLTPPIARRLFDAYRGPENIRGVLKAVYKNEEAITDELVDICESTGAIQTLSIFTDRFFHFYV